VKFESIQRQAITKNALKEQVSRIEKEIQQIDLDQTRKSNLSIKDIVSITKGKIKKDQL